MKQYLLVGYDEGDYYIADEDVALKIKEEFSDMWIWPLDDIKKLSSYEEYEDLLKTQADSYNQAEKEKQINSYPLRKVVYIDGRVMYYRDNESISFHGLYSVETLAPAGKKMPEDDLIIL